MTTFSPLASVSATRAVLEALGRSTRKALGQHFLIDDGIVGKILRLAALAPGERVVEVGPGIGTLTQALLRDDRGTVRLSSFGTKDDKRTVPLSSPLSSLLAVELDAELAAYLEQTLAAGHPELEVLAGDALSPTVLEELRRWEPAALVANLPYAVAATVVLEYFEQLPSLRSATVMVQREVAERICAVPGTKAYGAYTVKLQLVASVTGRFNVPPQCFYPPPRVESTVVRLERVRGTGGDDRGTVRLSSFVPKDDKRTVPLSSPPVPLTHVIDAAFFQRRKTVRNSMRAYFAEQGLNAEGVDTLLAQAGINPQVRGETLTREDFLRLITAQLPRASA